MLFKAQWFAAVFVLPVAMVAIGCDEQPASEPAPPAAPPATQPAAMVVPEGSTKVAYHVPGMHCAGCEAALVAAVTKVEGVSDARASRLEETVWVVMTTDAVRDEQIAAAVATTGYQVVAEPSADGD